LYRLIFSLVVYRKTLSDLVLNVFVCLILKEQTSATLDQV